MDVEHFIYPLVDGHLACFHLFRWGSGHSSRESVLVVILASQYLCQRSFGVNIRFVSGLKDV